MACLEGIIGRKGRSLMYWKIVSALAVLALLAGCFSFYVPDTTLADRLMQEGNWEAAMAAYQDALKDDPFNPAIQAKLNAAKGRVAAAYQERGQAALKERNLPQAIEAFKRALSLEPPNQEHQSALAQALRYKEAQDRLIVGQKMRSEETRLNSSHSQISYAVFCLKKKKK